METAKYVKGAEVRLKGNPSFDETWVRDRIVEDPSILGLGPLKVRAIERTQKYGRLDLVLVDDEEDDNEKWYEVELQLGSTDESHIIRTLEYWETEQRRYPKHSHCAILIAEDVTSRFLNVISLFNRFIPLIAIQMRAIQVQEYVVLNFAKVLDTAEIDEDEEAEDKEPIRTNREYWQARKSDAALRIFDDSFEILKQIASGLAPNYRQGFIGVSVNGRANNFVYFHPKKQAYVAVHARPANREEWAEKLRRAGIEVSSVGRRSVRFRLHTGEPEKQRDLLLKLFQDAYQTSIT